jgi:hypothetical protein
MSDSIVIEQRNEVAARVLHSQIAASGKPRILQERDHFDFWEFFAHPLHRAIRGRIVDQDDFKISKSLGAQRQQILFEESFPIHIQDDNADLSRTH